MEENELNKQAEIVKAARRSSAFALREAEDGGISFYLGDICLNYFPTQTSAEVLEDVVDSAKVFMTSIGNSFKQVLSEYYKSKRETFI